MSISSRQSLTLECGCIDVIHSGFPGTARERTWVCEKHRGISTEAPHRAWSVKPLLAWYDLWVGVYIDRKGHRAYVLPLPCIGFVVVERKP